MTSQALAAQSQPKPQPTTVPIVSTASLPQDLTAGHVFCLWRRVQVGDNLKKKPFSALTGKSAHTNNLQDFCSYSIAVKALENSNGKFSGIGRLLQHNIDSIYAIDIDHCVSGGVLNEYAYNLVRGSNSYAEFSPSGNGIRIFGRAPLPAALTGRCSVKIWIAGSHPVYPELETQLFLAGQYVTVTGNQVAGTPCSIADNDQFLDELLRSNPAKDYCKVAAAPALRPAAAAKKQSTGQQTIDYAEFGQAKPKTTNFWIKRLKETNEIFAKCWFKKSDMGGRKSNSEYMWDLVKTAYFTCQDELSPADMVYMLDRWCKLNNLEGQIKRIPSRMKSFYANAQSQFLASGKTTRRSEKNRKLRETRKTHTPPLPTTVGIGSHVVRSIGYGDRTKQVLALQADGLSWSRIAKQLGIAKSTVGNLIRRHAQKTQPVASSNPAPDNQEIPLLPLLEVAEVEEQTTTQPDYSELDTWLDSVVEAPEETAPVKQPYWPFLFPAPRTHAMAA